MSRGQYILRRLIQMIPVLIVVTIIVFVMVHMIPGDPAQAIAGPQASDATIARIRHILGLDQPLYVQYFLFMKNLFELNLGTSIMYRVPVASLIGQRVVVTLSLVGCTAVLSTIISLPLGILAALKKDSLLDNIVRSSLMVTMVMPSFWIGIMLIIIFAIHFRLVPVSGFGTNPLDDIYHLILPALTISLGLAPILIRSLRNSILEALGADYIKTARSKGLHERDVITVHVLRNALIPAVTLLGISVGFLMGGAIIIEKVFSLPGEGTLLINAVTSRDYPVIQSATLIFALLVILVNLATDILYSFLDPRVRLG